MPGLHVIARTSAFVFKGTNTDVREIGRRLDVGTVLEGSVRRAGRRLRITTKLVDVATARPVWSEQYDRELDDVFAIQDEIARAVARRLEPTRHALPKRERGTESLEAYEAYLRGKFFEAKRTPDDFATSVQHYERAVTLDARFAQAYNGLASALCYWAHVVQSRELMPRARREVDKALALDDSLAEAYATLGTIKFFGEWDWSGAVSAHERAVALNPGLAAPQAIVLTNLGRAEDAVSAARRAVALDPLAVQALQTLQFALHQASRHEESLQYGERALEVSPQHFLTHLNRGIALLNLERATQAERVFRTMTSTFGDEPMGRAGLVHSLMRLGRLDEAREMTGDLGRHVGSSSGQAAVSTAWACAAVGDLDSAFEWIDQAIAAREPFVASLPAFCWWDPLRNDERFERVLRPLAFPDWSIEASRGRARRY